MAQASDEDNPCAAVRRTAQSVVADAALVTINDDGEPMHAWMATGTAAAATVAAACRRLLLRQHCLLQTSSHAHPRLHCRCPPRRPAGVRQLAAALRPEDVARGAFDHELHFWDAGRPDLVAQYLLVVDSLVRAESAPSVLGGALPGEGLAGLRTPCTTALHPPPPPGTTIFFFNSHASLPFPASLPLPHPARLLLNFCFWPEDELEYEHLAGSLKQALLADPGALDAARLASIDGPGVRALLGWPRALPLEAERARLLREVGERAAECASGGGGVRLQPGGPPPPGAPITPPSLLSANSRLISLPLSLPRWAPPCWANTRARQSTWCALRASLRCSWCAS